MLSLQPKIISTLIAFQYQPDLLKKALDYSPVTGLKNTKNIMTKKSPATLEFQLEYRGKVPQQYVSVEPMPPFKLFVVSHSKAQEIKKDLNNTAVDYGYALIKNKTKIDLIQKSVTLGNPKIDIIGIKILATFLEIPQKDSPLQYKIIEAKRHK